MQKRNALCIIYKVSKKKIKNEEGAHLINEQFIGIPCIFFRKNVLSIAFKYNYPSVSFM